RDPLKPALSIRLAKKGMDAVVDDVAGDNQSDRRDVQACGVSRIGSPRIDRDKLAPLQLQLVSFERLSNQKAVRNIAGKKATPEVVDPGRRELFPHGPDDLRRRERFGARETRQKRCETKEMIAVAMGDIDWGEVLAAR